MLSDGRLQRSDVWRPAYGLRLPCDQTDPIHILRARDLRTPDGGAFSHTTAAFVRGAPMPAGRDGVRVVHITTPPGICARRGKGVRGYARPLAPEEIEVVDGVRCTTLLRTFCDLPDVLTVAEMVGFGDWLIGWGRTGVALDELRAHVESARLHAPRRALLLAVLERLDARSESVKESELRVLLEDHGLGPFELQVEIHDHDGDFVARPDLLLPHLKIAIEYEGDHHRTDKDQWRKDLRRRRRLEALGWKYITVTQDDLDNPRALLEDLRAAIRERA